jgi:hypothetical protein
VGARLLHAPPNVRQNLRFDGSHPAGYGHPDCAKTFIKDAYNIAAVASST